MRAKNFERTTPRQKEPQPPAPKVSASLPRVKLAYRETRELDELPGKIEALEREQADIRDRLCSPDIYRDCPEKARALQQRLIALDEELMSQLARWEELEGKLSAGHNN
jgi:ATP-binding cassette subfamily F protein uup